MAGTPMKRLQALPILCTLWAMSPQAAESPGNGGAPAIGKPVEITVYRSPSCTCCGRWLEHMKKNGFIIKDMKTEDMDRIKQEQGVPEPLRSCHTALVGGYVVEGHVPAADVAALLKQRPTAAGLTVPGMPVGTPGMEMGGRQDPFAVLEFDRNGKTRVFHEYGSD